MNPNEPDTMDDLLKRSVSAMRDTPVPDGPANRTKGDTLAAMYMAAGEVPSNGFLRKVLVMTFTHKKIAASIVMAAGGIAVWCMLAMFSSVSYAQVAEKIRAARTMTCTLTISSPAMKDPIITKVSFMEPDKVRFERTGGVSVAADGVVLKLDSATMRATVARISGHSYGRPSDPIAEFREMAKEKGEAIEDRRIGEIEAKGFRVKRGDRLMSMWVDPRSELPLRVEMADVVAGKQAMAVLSEMVFDVNLDQKLFSVEVPAGYELAKAELTISGDIEENIVGFLRLYAKKTGGGFPQTLDEITQYNSAAPGQVKAALNDAEIQQLDAHGGGLHGWTATRERGKDFDYTGRGSKLGDQKAMLFWFRTKEGDYRAVYGDLSVKAVKADALPEHEKEAGPTPPTPVPTK